MNEVVTKTKGMAEVGDKIQSKKGVIGIVEITREQSVIIKVLEAPSDIEFENDRTVVNHKNYKVI